MPKTTALFASWSVVIASSAISKVIAALSAPLLATVIFELPASAIVAT